MADKLIWTNHDTVDYLSGLEDDLLQAELKNYGFDDEMINSAPIETLRDIITTDDMFLQKDIYKFENDIAPLLAKTSEDGMITLSNGDHDDTIQPDEILDSDLIRASANLELYEGPEGYYFVLDDGNKISVVGDIVESLEEEMIEEAIDTDSLQVELEDLLADYDEFGVEGFYAVPFTSFRKEFPIFTKNCILSYLKSMEILTKDELKDDDLLNEYWSTGELIIPTDWDALFKGANYLVDGVKPQWDRLWTAQYNKTKRGEYEEN